MDRTYVKVLMQEAKCFIDLFRHYLQGLDDANIPNVIH